MTIKKSQIISCARLGIKLDGSDVARVSRNGRAITLRHSWSTSTDASVWYAVQTAYTQLAREMAAKIDYPIDVYSSDNNQIDQVDVEVDA